MRKTSLNFIAPIGTPVLLGQFKRYIHTHTTFESNLLCTSKHKSDHSYWKWMTDKRSWLRLMQMIWCVGLPAASFKLSFAFCNFFFLIRFFFRPIFTHKCQANGNKQKFLVMLLLLRSIFNSSRHAKNCIQNSRKTTNEMEKKRGKK